MGMKKGTQVTIFGDKNGIVEKNSAPNDALIVVSWTANGVKYLSRVARADVSPRIKK